MDETEIVARQLVLRFYLPMNGTGNLRFASTFSKIAKLFFFRKQNERRGEKTPNQTPPVDLNLEWTNTSPGLRPQTNGLT